MKNQNRLNVVLAVFWITVFTVIITFTLNGERTVLDNTQVNAPVTTVPEHPLQFEESDIQGFDGGSNNDSLSQIENCYWLLNTDESSQYAFKFSENNRVDIFFFDGKTERNGFSVYKQNADTIILEYLPDEIPIKEFTLTVKNNSLYFGEQELTKSEALKFE